MLRKEERTPREWPNENAGGLAARAKAYVGDSQLEALCLLVQENCQTRSLSPAALRWLEADSCKAQYVWKMCGRFTGTGTGARLID